MANPIRHDDAAPDAMAHALLEAMSEAVYVVDRGRRITYWNPAAERVTGFAADDVVGRRCRDAMLNHVDENGDLLCRTRCPLLSTMRTGEPKRAEVFLHHRDGHRVPVTVSAAALRAPDGRIRGAVEVFHDDTRYRTLAEQLDAAEAASLTDPLTGIGNRRMLARTLHRHLSDHRRYDRGFAVLFADIDHFKQVNDRYGHDTGDQILQLVASTLRDCVRPGDTVGRWGGEEFLIVAPVTEPDQARSLAERVRALTAAGWLRTEAGDITVTLSIGVATIQEDDTTASVVNRADAALLAAKDSGRDRVAVG